MHGPTAEYHGVPQFDPSLGGHDLKNHGRKASEAAESDVVASVVGVHPGGHCFCHGKTWLECNMGQEDAKNVRFEKLREIHRPVLGFNPDPQLHIDSTMPVDPYTSGIHLQSLSIGKGSLQCFEISSLSMSPGPAPEEQQVAHHAFGPSNSNPLLHCEHPPETTHRRRRRKSCQ